MSFRWSLVVFALSAWVFLRPAEAQSEAKSFRAGAAEVEITPTEFPRIISGGFLQGRADRAHDPLFARALVLDDGQTRLAIVVVDTLMMPRTLIDRAKERASKATGIPVERMLVSATHTHSAPSVMGALGTGVDEDYARRLPGWIAESVERAVKNLAPARIGWATAVDSQHTNCRRWIKRPDRIGADPFGGQTVRAMMHPGYQNPDYVGPSGPEDPGLSVLAVARASPAEPPGELPPRPVAVLANYSMHYYGAAPVSADYFGRFCRRFAKLVESPLSPGAKEDPAKQGPPFVAIMSQGTAGDLHWMDYSQPARPPGIDAYADELAKVALDAYRKIVYRDWVPLAMAESQITLKRRTPDEARLAWARKIVEGMKDPKTPTSIPEVYALEQFYLRDDPQCRLKLQAVRIGELGIAAFPAEVFGITGLKIKAQSPLETTFNIELANGADGYIPPPEQHTLGGYTTWPARTAGLEVQAEPVMVETLLQLLEQVSGKPRRKAFVPAGPYVNAVRASKPVAYWRLYDMVGPRAADASTRQNHATYQDGVALYLDGPLAPGIAGPGQTSRAAHFAGGRLKATLAGLGSDYSVECWFWNGLPSDARTVTGYLFSRSAEEAQGARGDHLGISGTLVKPGRLFFDRGDANRPILIGTTEIPLRTWHHVVLVRQGPTVAVYLDGQPKPEIAGEIPLGSEQGSQRLFVGGRGDGQANFEGKLCEVAVYDRPLRVEEIVTHYAASGAR
ncbi:MAG: hypothetical protein NUV77_21575 [Thermoguttaceae bacterium]|nr:hypothetical protein [Thermoguttaceae bacterium]